MRSFIRRHRRKLIALITILVLYVGSYIALSRRGMAEARTGGFDFFFYVPVEMVLGSDNWVDVHFFLVAFYSPLNSLDRSCGAGKSPCTSFIGVDGKCRCAKHLAIS